MAGFLSKKLTGFNETRRTSHGMTGKSSIRGSYNMSALDQSVENN